MMRVVWTILACAAALVGTTMQAVGALRELSRRPEAGAAVALFDFRSELRRAWWRPRQYRAHRDALRSLERESPNEAKAFRRLRTELWAWSLLGTAACLALIAAVLGQ